MQSNDLTQALEQLWSKQFPFVFFRLPDSDSVVCYFQKDNNWHQSADLHCSGFVMAPFVIQNKTTYIPDTHTKHFNNPSYTPPNTAITISENANEKSAFMNLVIKAKQAIVNQALEKVVVSRNSRLTKETNPCTIFQNLLNLYPTAMVTFWHHPKTGTWLGATPERLVSLSRGTLQTMALAGTQVYSKNHPAEWTPKEREEQQLVTDQLHSDLIFLYPEALIEKVGPYTKQAGNLQHLCTDFNVSGTVFKLKTLLDTIHPTPAVGGVPKDKSLSFIAQNENEKRDFYAGYLGIVSPDETALFVNLRCARWFFNQLMLYVGAGITASSKPESEWFETVRKSETFIRGI